MFAFRTRTILKSNFGRGLKEVKESLRRSAASSASPDDLLDFTTDCNLEPLEQLRIDAEGFPLERGNFLIFFIKI